MNTTTKYIHEKNELDFLDLREKGINELVIKVESENDITFNLAKYIFDEDGFLRTKKRHDQEWTAFPALNLKANKTLDSKHKKIEFNFEDSFIRNSRDELVKIETKNLTTDKLVTIHHFEYHKGHLTIDSRIDFSDDGNRLTEEKFYLDENKNIVRSKKQADLLDSQRIEITNEYVRNQNNQIFKKKNIFTYYFGESTVIKKSSETLTYNSNNQLIETSTIGIAGEELFTTQKTFTYLDNVSELIKSIEVKEEGIFHKSIQYEYNNSRKLVAIIYTNQQGKKTQTHYVRK